MNWFLKFIQSILDRLFKPKPQPTPPPLPVEDGLLGLHNQHRAKIGVGNLTISPKLEAAAQSHSQWMHDHDVMSHYEDGLGAGDRVTREGYRWSYVGENIANGYPNDEAVFQGWLNSPGHRANIENAVYTDVGFGRVGNYWTVIFARPMMFAAHGQWIRIESAPGELHEDF